MVLIGILDSIMGLVNGFDWYTDQNHSDIFMMVVFNYWLYPISYGIATQTFILQSFIQRCVAVISVPVANYWGLPGPAPRPIHFVDLPLHCAFRNGKEQTLRLTDQYFSANIWCCFNCV
jgi:hypothetical protein